jgi:isoleucyl-tRNA synthetase
VSVWNGSKTGASTVDSNERPEIDRWILSNLQSLTATAHAELSQFNAPGFCAAAAAFIDDLSNWYIRRNRRRFWRSKDAGDADKNAAYETLYEVLVTLCRLLAPCMPFLTERMYQNLILGTDPAEAAAGTASEHPHFDLPRSVHLCDYPIPDDSLLDAALNQRMAAAQKVVRLGHKLREDANLRVRQPLAELRFSAVTEEAADAVEKLADVIAEELNIKKVVRQDNLDSLVSYNYKPNLKTLGPRFGKLLNLLRTQIPELGDAVLSPLRRGINVTVNLDGNEVELSPDDVLISTAQAALWSCGDDSGIQIAISTVLTADLIREGMSRDFVRQVQQLRKDAGLNIQDRIRVVFAATDTLVTEMVTEWGDYIRSETLADSIETAGSATMDFREVNVGSSAVAVGIIRSS